MVRIAYITDTHLGQKAPAEISVNPELNFKMIVEDIKRRRITHIVFGGDIGSPEYYDPFFELLSGYRLNLTPGNHDKVESLTRFLPKCELFTDRLFTSYLAEGFRLIFLDSSSGEIGRAQLEWLNGQLDSALKVILFVHHPILKVNERLDLDFGLKNRQQVTNMLQQSEKEIHLFCGHYHTDGEVQYNHIRQAITLSAAYQAKATPEGIHFLDEKFGYRIITISDGSIQSELVQFFRSGIRKPIAGTSDRHS